MEEYFKKFIKNISLTETERNDAITKYIGVCKALNKEFYDSEYHESVKFLFGSYKKKTTISHPEKDVDVIFKIPESKFEEYKKQENGPSNLLTRIKNVLKDKYPTTDRIKNWTKVVLVDFVSFKIEVLPAFEKKDGDFKIPNTGSGENWANFDPKKEIEDFNESNKKTGGLTRDLIKIVKKWKIENNIDIKTYIIDEYVIDFLTGYNLKDYPNLILDFFRFLKKKKSETFVDTAISRAEKALKFSKDEKFDKAIEEYKKIFGVGFPKVIKKKEVVGALKYAYEIAPNEEFIENIVKVELNNDYFLKINCRVDQNGHRPSLLKSMIGRLLKNKKLEFFIENTNVIEPFNIKWKVRNFGEEAGSKEDLRGEIVDDPGWRKKEENTKYKGEHRVWCYLIKDGVCVAMAEVIVPISNF